MKPVYQTKFNEDGNCLAACIASILEIPIEDVSSFDSLWWEVDLFYFLRKYNRTYVRFNVESEEALSSVERFYLDKDVYSIAVGPTPRHTDFLHAVVYCSKFLAHDPHPEGKGLDSVSYFIVSFFLEAQSK